MENIVPNIEEIGSYLEYVPGLGRLMWIKKPARSINVGAIAGALGNGGYRYVRFQKKGYLEHRLIWLICKGEWPTQHIDHINGDRQDNRIENLRDVSMSTNKQNVIVARRDSLTGILGVSRSRNKFTSKIFIDGANVYLGTFDTAEEAHQAYLMAKRQFHEGCTI